MRPRAGRPGGPYPARQRADAHSSGDRRRRFGGPRERASAPRGLRHRPRHPPPDHAAHLRAVLHLLRPRPGRRPRARDRARARRAHGGGAVGAVRARRDHFLAQAARMRRPVVLLVCGALAGGCGGGAGSDGGGSKQTRTTTTKVEVLQDAGGADAERRTSFDPRAIYRDEAPGVVTVISLFGGGGLDSVLGGDDNGSGGVGSGFVVSRNGEIATNAHVVTTGE